MKYYVTYNSADGDCTTVWVNADSIDEAKNVAMHDYWDIMEIINIRKA